MSNSSQVLFVVELNVKSITSIGNEINWIYKESERCEKQYEGALNIIVWQAKSLLPDAIKNASKIYLKEGLTNYRTKPALKLEVVVEVANDEVKQVDCFDWFEDLRMKLFEIFKKTDELCMRIQSNNPEHPERVIVKHGLGKDSKNTVFCEDKEILTISEKLRNFPKKEDFEQTVSLMSDDGRRVKLTIPSETAITLVHNRSCFINIDVRSLDKDSQECRIVDVDNNRSVKLNFNLADIGTLCSVIPDGKIATCEVCEAYRYKRGKRIPIRYVLQRVVEVHEDLIAQIS